MNNNIFDDSWTSQSEQGYFFKKSQDMYFEEMIQSKYFFSQIILRQNVVYGISKVGCN